ncbi:polysaccharide pyruvyl transferase family protein [Candidatus Parcubacteria bacterium]|nr:polysaccharide pyruvyl transferase family protein [Candidatus Parcubacteria bacterium]
MDKMDKKLNILSVSWVGQGDFGDDAMAYGLRQFLMKRGIGSITYYQYGKFPEHIYEKDLKIFSLYSFETKKWIRNFKDKFNLKKFNAVIIGGGSTLHSYNSVKWKLDLIKNIKKINSGPVFSSCVGISIGPFKSESSKEVCKELFNMVDFAVLRDNHSFELAKSISGNKNIYSSLDTTLLLPNLCADKMFNFKKNKNCDKNNETVGMMFVKNKSYEEIFKKNKYFEKYLAIVNHVLKKNKKVILFTFYTGDAYSDQNLNQALKKHAKFPDKIDIYNYDGNIFNTVKELKKCGYIISMRLHGIIFSYMLGIPFLSLGYDQKNKNFCDSINYPREMSLDTSSLENLDLVLNPLDLMFTQNLNLFNNTIEREEAAATVEKNLNYLVSGIKQTI